MASQQTSFQPGSKTDWRKCLASVPHCIDDPHPQDILCEVKDKLTAVTDLLAACCASHRRIAKRRGFPV
jgi:hypothetical protein